MATGPNRDAAAEEAAADTATLELAGDGRSPGLARRFVAGFLAERDLSHLSDTARLLVTELTTNAVVHAGSDLQVSAAYAAGLVRIAVRDVDTGPIAGPDRGGDELSEGGRGLLLVDALAESWGVTHGAGFKTIWFTVAAEPGHRPVQADAAPSAADPAPTAMLPRLSALLLPREQRDLLSGTEQLGELLSRICEAGGVDAAEAELDTDPPLRLRRGPLSAPVSEQLPLVHGGRRLGVLRLSHPGPVDAETAALWQLAAVLVAMLVAETGLAESGRRREDRLDLLAEATELLAGSLDVGLTLALLAQIVVPRIAEWCAVYAVDERGRTQLAASHHQLEAELDTLAAVLATDRDIRSCLQAATRLPGVQRPPAAVPVGGRRAHVSALALRARSRTVGVLLLGRSQSLDAVDLMTAEDLTRRAALAVDNARLYATQAAAAQALQASLLPVALAQPAGLALAARYHSASPGLAVGGDFYDAFGLPDGSTVVAVGDVCGKGAEAAAVTGVARDVLRLLLAAGGGLAGSLRQLNTVLRERPASDRFCTVALCQLASDGGGVRARLCLAGHPEPVHVHAGGAQLVGTAGSLLGVLDDADLVLTESELALAPGDALLLYTDGVTERRAGERMFGQHGLLRAVATSYGLDAEQLVAGVEGAALAFVDSPLRDDLALLAARVQP